MENELLIAGIILFCVLAVFVAFRFRNKIREENEILRVKLEVQEKTFNDTAHLIHNNISQILAVVNLTLYGVKPADTEAASQIQDTIELVNKVIADLRGLSRVLNSRGFADQPLSFLLRHEIETISHVGTFHIQWEHKGEEIKIDPTKQLIILRIAQQFIQNATKHAEAKNIFVLLEYQAGICKLEITDDGKGFSVEELEGLTNLKVRAAIVDGNYIMKSEPGIGAKFLLSVPLA